MSETAHDPRIDDLTREMAAAGLLPPVEIVERDEEELEAEEAAIPSVARPLNDDELSTLVAELEAEEAKKEIYAEQEPGAGFVEPIAIEGAEEADKPAGDPSIKVEGAPFKPARERKAPAPRVARFAAGAGAFAASLAGRPELAELVDGLPKKVKDKAGNLIEHLVKGKPLSVYTRTAIEILKDQGALSSKLLVDAFQNQAKRNGGEGYSIGTARSQAQQQITLLSRLGIARQSGGVLVVNSGNWMAERLFGETA